MVVADDAAERSQGLRGRATLDPYDGMLFVFGEPVESPFTMATVPVALDIGFYDGAGPVVDRPRMTPCAGTDADVPGYRLDRPVPATRSRRAPGELPPAASA